MENDNIIWLASYPRSGNTFLRTILWHCFGLHSSSIYPNDFLGNKELEAYVGHIEDDPSVPGSGVRLIKTHELPGDNNRAIYIIRDGRAACVSLWKFFNYTLPLESIIEGLHKWGTWGNHVMSWDPWNRTNTLLLRYELLLDDLPSCLASIEGFLQKPIIATTVPDRNTIVVIDGRWVTRKEDRGPELSETNLERFVRTNRVALERSGYMY